MKVNPEKGIHWPTMIANLVAGLTLNVYAQLLLPNLPFLIKFYFPDIEDSDVGYYVGFLLSIFYLGQIPGSIFWGWFADTYGRKLSMILISINNIVFILALGFSRSYALSLVIRFVHGLLDSSLGLTKTIVADLCNDSNMAFGTALLYGSYAIGCFVGPLIGGYLSDMSVIRPLVYIFPLLKSIPYLLPLAICAFLYLIVLILFVFFSAESISEETIQRTKEVRKAMGRELSSILRKSSSKSFTSYEQLLLAYDTHGNFISMFRNKDLIIAVLVYGLASLCQMSFDAIYPLTLMNPPSLGGFAMDALEESWISTCGVILQLASLLIFPAWSRLMPYRGQCVICLLLLAVLMTLEPAVSLFNETPKVNQFAITFFAYAITIPIRTLVFNVCIVLISNSTYKEFRGAAIGLGQVASGVCRFVGPSLLPVIFSWSTAVNQFPVYYGFSYFLIGTVYFFTAALPLWISNESNVGRGSVYESVHYKEHSYISGYESDQYRVTICYCLLKMGNPK